MFFYFSSKNFQNSFFRSIKTITKATTSFLLLCNQTCGRISVHQSGSFVVVSNWEHLAIAIFRINKSQGPKRGELLTSSVHTFHFTQGETPRNFQFDVSGKYLFIADQDTDTVAAS